jgi:propanediol dehydratase small subunit
MATKKKTAKRTTARQKASAATPKVARVAFAPTGREIAFAHEMMSGSGTTMETAAELAGIPKEQAKAVWESMRVRRYCAEFTTMVAKEMAAKTASHLKAIDLTPDSVLMSLNAILNTPLSITKGNGAAQVAAGEIMLKAMNAIGSIPEMFKGKTTKQLENYAAHGSFDPPVITAPAGSKPN